MRLKNKKTGEIGKLLKLQDDDELEVMTDDKCYRYKTLAEVAEQWEDYEEPKASIYATGPVEKDDNTVLIEFYNHEEAEKAVKKLKAWKRLKDAGFKPTHHVLDYRTKTAKILFKANWVGDKDPEAEQLYEAFCLLFFGGEE